MSNIDFITEKWRTCRRTRNLANVHLFLSIVPMIYIAVYAEAQHRDQNNKELGAALVAILLNLFHLPRAIMGLVQLSPFVAWCKHANECMGVLQTNGVSILKIWRERAKRRSKKFK